MKPFGEEFEEPHALETRKDVDEETSILASAGSAARVCAPVVSLIVAVAVVIVIVLQSGSHTALGASPKALVVVVEGLKGTTFEEIGIHGARAPNLAALVRTGQYAACQSPSDTRCCRAQSGRLLGGTFEWASAPGIASIVTGVDSAKHGVYNDTYKAMSSFAASAKTYPSMFATATKNNLRTAVVGSGPMVTAVGGAGKCTDYGVLDFECGSELTTRCLMTSSCNAKQRVSYATPARREHDEAAGKVKAGAAEAEGEGGLVSEADDTYLVRDVQTFVEDGADLIGMHLAMPGGVGPSSRMNPRYAAELYRADAVLGQVFSVVRERAQVMHENWLVVVVGDRGAATNVANDADLVGFAGAVITAGGPLRLRAPTVPTRQFDVAPTVLQWFGLLSDEAARRADGRVQLVCSTGKEAANCTDL